MNHEYFDDYSRRYGAKTRKTRLLREGELEEIQQLIKDYFANVQPDLPLNSNEANYETLAENINEQYKNLDLRPRFICDLYNDINTNVKKNIAKVEAIKNYIRQVLRNPNNTTSVMPETQAETDTQTSDKVELQVGSRFGIDPVFQEKLRALNNQDLPRSNPSYWVKAAYNKPDLPRRIEVLNEGLTELPDNEKLLQNLAVCYTDAGRYEEAIKCNLYALKLYPNNPELNANYALTLHSLGLNYDVAEKHFQKAIELQPEHYNNNAHYGWFLQTVREDYKRAAEQYETALKVYPENTYALLHYGWILCFINFMPEKGIPFLEKALRLIPDDATTLGNLAFAFTTYQINLLLAEKYFNKAIALDPDNPFKHANYAQLLFVIGKKKEALKSIELAQKYAGNRSGIILEIEFYLYAHCPEISDKAKRNIQALISNGINDEYKNFSINIKAAIKNGHPDIPTLLKFAEQISRFKYGKDGQMLFTERI